MNELPELLDHYFSLGVAEGKEGRDHDTKDGEAQATRDLIDQKILRLQRELEEAKEFRAILEGHLGAAIDDYNEALARAEAAEAKLAEAEKKFETADKLRVFWNDKATEIADKLSVCRRAAFLRAKAEETGR